MSANDIGVNYATAFIDSLKTAEDLQKAGDDLETFSGLLEQLPALTRVLENPGMPLERRKGILEEVLSKLNPHPVSNRLFRLIIEKGRVRQVKDIAEAFAELKAARVNVATAEVVTATPLDNAGRAAWEKSLARLTGKKVTITYKTDSDLIGGALTRVGSTVYDGSVKRQVERIRGILLSERGEKGA
ncbi:MAG TPA: ATP synthase F1 subunit delta [Patescibacteria group bacterium]|nr:ATP synthase F1 subunit delta [Patescibacteria group bacterium]